MWSRLCNIGTPDTHWPAKYTLVEKMGPMGFRIIMEGKTGEINHLSVERGGDMIIWWW
jgi:hypothetical protein